MKKPNSILCILLLVSACAFAQQADLAITKDSGRTEISVGEQITHIITVSNGGPDAVTGATVEDVMPADLFTVQWTCTGTGGAQSAAGSGTGNIDDTADIPAGAMLIYTVTGYVSATAVGTISNTATVALPAGVIDPNPANNTATDTDAVIPQSIENVRPAYINTLPSQNAMVADAAPAPDNGASAFGGHVGPVSAPENPDNEVRYVLQASMLGQPLLQFKASPTYSDDLFDYARKQLFYTPGEPAEQNNVAAFRYINTFFNVGVDDDLKEAEMRLDNALPYNATIQNDGVETDEERALRVAGDIINALRFEPFNKDLRNLLLDIYYYRTLGRQVVAKDQVIRAYQINFSTDVSEQEPFGGAINKEIAAFETAAAALTGVLDPYRELLLGNFGVNVSEFDMTAAGGVPFGYYLFTSEVPHRSIYAATYTQVFDPNTGQMSGGLTPLNLGDAANYGVMYVSPTGFAVSEMGKPAGSDSPSVTFTISNIGTAELAWRATVKTAPTATGSFLSLGPNNSTDFVEGTVAVGRTQDVVVYVAANHSPLMRTGSVLVSDTGPKGLSYTVSVTQNGSRSAKTASAANEKSLPDLEASGPLLVTTPEEILCETGATTRSFTVLEPESFQWMAAVGSGADWLGINSIDTATGEVNLNISENASATLRMGTVTVTAVGATPATRTVTVWQDGQSATGITVGPNLRTVPNTGGVAQGGISGNGFAVGRAGTGNVTWTAAVTQGQDWLRIVSGRSGANEGEILFSWDENRKSDGRVGEITVQSLDAIVGQNVVTVQVAQLGIERAPVLTSGFKDLSLIFDVLRDEAQVKKELAKRYALRGLQGDHEKANRLISETITRHTATLSDLGSIIPNWRNMVDPNSDIIGKYMEWQQAVAELNTTKDFLNGDANVLGFQTDFLFLVQDFQGQDEGLFDSFDKLLNYMYDGENNTAMLASPLGYAHDKFLTARKEYDTYLNTQSELREELRTQNLEHRLWIFQNVGIDPGNDVDNPNNPDQYRNPSGNYGSNIWLQDRSIERANEQLRQNGAQLDNIYGQINTELWRRAQESQINSSIGDVYVKYGDQLATIEEEIGYISAGQAAANQLIEICNAEAHIFSAGASVAGRVANALFQAGMEKLKGDKNATKQRLAAQEQRDILQLQDQTLGNNSRAVITNLYGQASLIEVQSAELMVAIAQEFAKRQALIDEWHYRESLIRENNKALLGRSFADPVHRMRMRRAMLEAESSFKVAQQWVFYALRALEYKWNTPFAHTNAAGTWSLGSVFRSRTAKDLIDLMAALKDFDGIMQGSARGDDRFDWFSFKKDFMGLTPVYASDGKTELRVYSHPLTGYAATATEVFQARLKASYNKETGLITLPFSTYNDNGETFFRGPRRDPNDPTVVLSRGQYLDKIVWMKVNLVGEFDTSQYQRVMGTLSYSGGGYLRNARVGRVVDPTRPDLIEDEFTRWPTKFWFYDSGLPQADPPVMAAWRSSNDQTTEIAINLTAQPRAEMPDTVSRIDVFRERSVACDGWVLKIFAEEDGEPRIAVEDLEDIEILFYHTSKDRAEITKSGAGAQEGATE